MKNNRTLSLVLIPVFSALIAVGAFIRIPVGIVPVSSQLVFCALSGIILGSRKGAASVGLYILIGLMGVPVFTGGGGPQYVFYPTFGYLVGLMIAAFVIGLVSERTSGKKFVPILIACIAGMLIVYTIGVFWLFMIKNSFMAKTALSLKDAIIKGALIFMIGDTLWCFAATFIGTRINRITGSKYLK